MSTISSTSVLSFLTWSRLATVTIGTYWSLSIWEMRYMSLARFSLMVREEPEAVSSGDTRANVKSNLYLHRLRWLHFSDYHLQCPHLRGVTLNRTLRLLSIKPPCLGNPKGDKYGNVNQCSSGHQWNSCTSDTSVHSCCTPGCVIYATVNQVCFQRKCYVDVHGFTF